MGSEMCIRDREKPIDAKDNGVFFLNSRVRYDDITDGSSHTIFIGEKLPDGWDLHWLSGTRATLRNTGVPICWLTYGNGLPRPGGPAPPPMLTVPNFFEEAEPVDDTVPAADGAANPADPAAPPAAPADAPPTLDGAAAPAPAPVPVVGPTKLAVLPGNPLFVGGFASVHPNIALFAMGDGSIRALTRNMPPSILQRFANRADGKLISSDY